MGFVGGGPRPAPSARPLLTHSPSRLHLCAVLILIAVGLEVAPSPGERPLLPPQAAGVPSREELLRDPRAPSPLGSLLPPSWQETAPSTAERLARAVTPESRPVPPSLDSAPPPAGVSSAIFFVPGFLLLVPGGANGLRGGAGRGGGGPWAGPRR